MAFWIRQRQQKLSMDHGLFGELVLICCLLYSCLYLEIQLCLRTHPRKVFHSSLSYGSQSLGHALSQEDPRNKILQEKKVRPLEMPNLIANIVKEDIVLSDCLTSFNLIYCVTYRWGTLQRSEIMFFSVISKDSQKSFAVYLCGYRFSIFSYPLAVLKIKCRYTDIDTASFGS